MPEMMDTLKEFPVYTWRHRPVKVRRERERTRRRAASSSVPRAWDSSHRSCTTLVKPAREVLL